MSFNKVFSRILAISNHLNIEIYKLFNYFRIFKDMFEFFEIVKNFETDIFLRNFR